MPQNAYSRSSHARTSPRLCFKFAGMLCAVGLLLCGWAASAAAEQDGANVPEKAATIEASDDGHVVVRPGDAANGQLQSPALAVTGHALDHDETGTGSGTTRASLLLTSRDGATYINATGPLSITSDGPLIINGINFGELAAKVGFATPQTPAPTHAPVQPGTPTATPTSPPSSAPTPAPTATPTVPRPVNRTFVTLLSVKALEVVASIHPQTGVVTTASGLARICYVGSWTGPTLLHIAICHNAACTNKTVRSLGGFPGHIRSCSITLRHDNVPIVAANLLAFGSTLQWFFVICGDPLCAGPLELQDNIPSSTAPGYGVDVAVSRNTTASTLFSSSISYSSSGITLESCLAQDCQLSGPESNRVTSLAASHPGTDIATSSTRLAPWKSNGVAVVFESGTTLAVALYLCEDAACSSPVFRVLAADSQYPPYPDVAVQAETNIPLVVYFKLNTGLVLLTCNTAMCTLPTPSVVANSLSTHIYYQQSMVLRSDGLPVITTYDLSTLDLVLFVCHVANCAVTTRRTLDAYGDVGLAHRLAVTGGNLPVVSYIRKTGYVPEYDETSVMLLTCGDETCTSPTHTVDLSDHEQPAVQAVVRTDSRQYPVVLKLVMLGNGSHALVLLVPDDRDFSSHTSSVVVVAPNITAFAMQLDGLNSLPSIAYSSLQTSTSSLQTSTQLVFVKCMTRTCQAGSLTVTTLVSGMGPGATIDGRITLALDEAHTARIVYRDASANVLRLVLCTSIDCKSSLNATIDDGSSTPELRVGVGAAIAILATGEVAVASSVLNDNNLAVYTRLHVCNDLVCSSTTGQLMADCTLTPGPFRKRCMDPALVVLGPTSTYPAVIVEDRRGQVVLAECTSKTCAGFQYTVASPSIIPDSTPGPFYSIQSGLSGNDPAINQRPIIAYTDRSGNVHLLACSGTNAVRCDTKDDNVMQAAGGDSGEQAFARVAASAAGSQVAGLADAVSLAIDPLTFIPFVAWTSQNGSLALTICGDRACTV